MPTRGLVLRRSVRFRPGTYYLPDDAEQGAIRIEGTGFTVDLAGVRLAGARGRPWERRGIGILVRGARDVALRNATVSGYRIGIKLERCRRVRILDSDVSRNYDQRLLSTAEKYDRRDWLNIFERKAWETYGYGLFLEKCRDCRIERVTSQRHQNGIALVDSERIAVGRCRVSHNSGWGIWMWNASDSVLVGNEADWCVRCESPHYSAGGDSAGIMLSNNCCRNVIALNTMTHGGDGFFLNGLNPRRLGIKESTDNLVAFNDASHSPHNAFESSWSRGNVFVGNIASNSRYGMWLGLSYENRVIGNLVEHNLFDGIAIEHAHDNLIAGNRVRHNRAGIHLLFRKKNLPRSRDYRIEGNIVEDNQVGLLLNSVDGAAISGNEIARNGAALHFKGACREVRLSQNNLRRNGALGDLTDTRSAFLDDNWWDGLTSARVRRAIKAAQTRAVRIGTVARRPFPAPRLPVGIDYPTPDRKRDRSFIWYKGLKRLIGL